MVRWFFSFLLIFNVGAGSLNAQGGNHALYGYFFYTIAKNVEWPADYKTGDFVIGILGDSPVTQYLQMMAQKKDVAGRPIKIAEYSSVAQIS